MAGVVGRGETAFGVAWQLRVAKYAGILPFEIVLTGPLKAAS